MSWLRAGTRPAARPLPGELGRGVGPDRPMGPTRSPTGPTRSPDFSHVVPRLLPRGPPTSPSWSPDLCHVVPRPLPRARRPLPRVRRPLPRGPPTSPTWSPDLSHVFADLCHVVPRPLPRGPPTSPTCSPTSATWSPDLSHVFADLSHVVPRPLPRGPWKGTVPVKSRGSPAHAARLGGRVNGRGLRSPYVRAHPRWFTPGWFEVAGEVGALSSCHWLYNPAGCSSFDDPSNGIPEGGRHGLPAVRA